MQTEYRKHLLPTLARTSPVMFALVLLMYCIVQPSYNSFYLFVMYFIVLCSSWVIKNLIIKPFYKLIRQTDVPVLTFGMRPEGARGCHKFTVNDKLSTTFGLPSNHSQLIWAVVVYVLCKITINWNNATKSTVDDKQKTITAFGHIWIIFSWVFLLSFALYVSYSRIYIEECNTVFQIIVSSILGGVCGFVIYYFEDDAVNFLRSKMSESPNIGSWGTGSFNFDGGKKKETTTTATA